MRLTIISDSFRKTFDVTNYARKYFVPGNVAIISEVNILGDEKGYIRITSGKDRFTGVTKYYIYFDAVGANEVSNPDNNYYSYTDKPGVSKVEADEIIALKGKTIRVYLEADAPVEAAPEVAIGEPVEAEFTPSADENLPTEVLEAAAEELAEAKFANDRPVLEPNRPETPELETVGEPEAPKKRKNRR